jgi:hypothetical protein
MRYKPRHHWHTAFDRHKPHDLNNAVPSLACGYHPTLHDAVHYLVIVYNHDAHHSLMHCQWQTQKLGLNSRRRRNVYPSVCVNFGSFIMPKAGQIQRKKSPI